MANPFDQFDAQQDSGNPFDQFDTPQQAARAAYERSRSERLASGRQYAKGYEPDPLFADIPESQPKEKRIGHPLEALIEPANVLASGAIAAPLAGVVGLGAAAGRLFGANIDPEAAIDYYSRKLTYEPRTKVGDIATQGITYPFRKLAELGHYTGDVTSEASGSPALGATVNTAIQAAPALLLRGKAPRQQPQPVQLTPAEQVIANARQAGLKLTPQQAEAGVTGRTAATMTGRAQLERELSIENAPRVNSLAQEEIGLPGKPTLDRSAISKKRAEANKVYAEASQLPAGKYDAQFKTDVNSIGNRTGSASFPGDTNLAVESLKTYYSSLSNFNPADVVAKVRQLRADGYRNQGKVRSPEENAKGHAQIQIANALEGALERHAASVGKPDLVTRFKEARTKLAKINTIERSIRGTDISARAIHSAARRGEPLSGNLKTIADAYESFDRVFQDPSKVRSHGPFSVVDYMLGAGGLVANPALTAAVLARPATRAFLRSGPYQNALIPRPTSRNALRYMRPELEFDVLASQQVGQ